jgi:hypothetical protein
MATTISGSTGVTYPNGGLDNTTGAGVGTTDTQTLTNKTIQGGAITSGTAVASTSGTSIDFTSIPSWVKRITVMYSGVSTNGTSDFIVQLGDSGGIEITGYVSTVITVASSATGTSYTAGFGTNQSAAASTYSGQIIISLMDTTTNTWAYTSTITSGGTTLNVGGGGKSLSATLDRVRITTVGGVNTFDAGSINILYEG